MKKYLLSFMVLAFFAAACSSGGNVSEVLVEGGKCDQTGKEICSDDFSKILVCAENGSDVAWQLKQECGSGSKCQITATGKAICSKAGGDSGDSGDSGSTPPDSGDSQTDQVCGDGIVSGTEKCDDGSRNGRYGYCAEDCSGPGPRCGDGKVNGSEACDDGENNGSYGFCKTDCSGQGARCGDGAVNGTETCDDGADNGTSGHCNSECSAKLFCGDGIKTEPESCDDGENNGTYGFCKADCSAIGEHCGDGIVNGPEVCDEGGDNGVYGKCNAGCSGIARCGDGEINGPEVCDDGDENNGTYGYCLTDCSALGEHCGDGIVNGPERCDDGEENGFYGKCNQICAEIAKCGDGLINGPEYCDDGEENGNYGKCGTNCASLGPHCGDGTVNGPEICDSGENNGNYNYCNTECTAILRCGDGIRNGSEVCDSGADNGHYGSCDSTCTSILTCGDGTVNGPESCDDGANNGTYDHCKADCTGPGAHCGDGTVNGPELCDDGAKNGTYNFCNETCSSIIKCGDGIINGTETCDDGSSNGFYGHCNFSCTGSSYCGDAEVNGPESCDEGELNGEYNHCKTDCTGLGPHCGDGEVNGDENCDDGDESNGTYGYCNTTCTHILECGDGVITAGNENCDDGANNGTYGYCKTDCSGLGPHCGDGEINGDEICDEGELNGTNDHCNTFCNGYTNCGDGVLDFPEVCDHGDLNGTYGHCNSLCSGLASYCGDGVIDYESGEECEPDLPVTANCTERNEEDCTAATLVNVTTGSGAWTVPEDGYYRLTVAGAQGGNGSTGTGGKGNIVTSIYRLTAGQQFYYSVGAKGSTANNTGGGGGASFIGLGSSYSLAATTTTILVVAGGGGGAAYTSSGSSSSSISTSISSTDGGTNTYGGGGGGLTGSASGRALSLGGAGGAGKGLSGKLGGAGGNGGGGGGYHYVDTSVEHDCNSSLCLFGCEYDDMHTYDGGGGGGLKGGAGGAGRHTLPSDCDSYLSSSSMNVARSGSAGTSYRRTDNTIQGVVYVDGPYGSATQTGNGMVKIERVCARYKEGTPYCNRTTCTLDYYLSYNNECQLEEQYLRPMGCGNNVLEGDEVCEHSSYSTQSCNAENSGSEVYSYTAYARCNKDCSGYDYSECIHTCGNRLLDRFSDSSLESCDINVTMPSYISNSFDTTDQKAASPLRADNRWNIFTAVYWSDDIAAGRIRAVRYTTNGSSERPREMRIYFKTGDDFTLEGQTWQSIRDSSTLVYQQELDSIRNGRNEFVLNAPYTMPKGKKLLVSVVQIYDTSLDLPAETHSGTDDYDFSYYPYFLRSGSTTEPLSSTLTKATSYYKPLLETLYDFATNEELVTCEDNGFSGGEMRCVGCQLSTAYCTQ